ncbi:MAG: hypothetical protein OXF46_09485 [Rhodobacteraceae bacterium]|nr:hypothetical protein [Paracoccaceae bacterium]
MSVDLIPDFHEELKTMAHDSGQSIKKYVRDTMKERIQKDKAEEDRLWGELAEEARKEGFIGKEKSENLLHRMKNA